MIKLAGVVKKFWKGKYKLLVFEGFVPYGDKKFHRFQHGEKSLHYAGRAFDISLIDSPENNGDKLGDIVPEHTMRKLAGLAYYNAQFTFVHMRKSHLHVSCDVKSKSSLFII